MALSLYGLCHHSRDLQGRRQLPPPVPPRNATSPDPVHEETESGDAAYTTYVRSRPLSTPHLHLLHTSAIILHTSSFLQLFIHQSYGHTFPITQKTSEPKVHEVSRYSLILRMIKPSHFRVSSCSVCCHVMAVFFPYAAILSRLIHTGSSSYTLCSSLLATGLIWYLITCQMDASLTGM